MLLIFFDSSLNSLVLSSVPYSAWTSTATGIVIERTSVLRFLVINSNKSPTESPDPASDSVLTCLKGTCNTTTLFLASYLTSLASSFQPYGSGGSMKLGHVWNRLQISHVIFRVIYMSRYVCQHFNNVLTIQTLTTEIVQCASRFCVQLQHRRVFTDLARAARPEAVPVGSTGRAGRA